MSKKEIKILIGIICVTPLAFLFSWLAMLNGTVTCAKVVGENNVKNNVSYQIIYIVNGEKVKSGISSLEFNLQNFDSLKKMDCIQIRYSNWINKMTELADPRLVKR